MAFNTKFNIMQLNGQRIYTSTFPVRNLPPRGSEVFVGNLPQDLFEDELIPLFSQVAPMYKLRLMMDFSGNTRGFAFITYFSVQDANMAVSRFNKRLVRSKTRQSFITVHVSVDNCRLYFGNVPKNKTAEDVQEELSKVIDGIVKVFIYAEKTEPLRNRGFAFVEFESHCAAAIARRKLLAGIMDLWSDGGHHHKVYVDWAEPEPIVDPMVLMQVKILYFRNVPLDWPTERFRQFIIVILKNLQIVKIFKRDNYAFVHFYTRRGAENALKIINSKSSYMCLESGHQIEVQWARPSTYSKKNRANHWPDNFCTSVPPQSRKLIRENKNMIKHSRENDFKSSSSEDDYCSFEQSSTESEDNLTVQFGKLSC